MSVIRIIHNKENPFVQLNKKALCDNSLSLKAVGLWARCMSRPTDWTFRISELIANGKEGKRSIYSAVNELIESGYCVRVQGRNGVKGCHLGAVEYYFFEFKLNTEEIDKFKKSLLRCGFVHAHNAKADSQGDTYILTKIDNTKKKETKKEARPKSQPSPLATKLLAVFSDSIKKHSPEIKKAFKPEEAKHFDFLLKKGYSEDQILKCIEFSLTNDFWQQHVTTPNYFKLKIDKFVLALKSKTNTQSQEKSKNDTAEGNRDWLREALCGVHFDYDNKMTTIGYVVEIKSGRTTELVGFNQPNFKDIITNKLRSFGLYNR